MFVTTGSNLGLYGENGNEPGWAFAITPLYENQLGEFCDYIAENWDSFDIDGDPVIGHVSWLGTFGESSPHRLQRIVRRLLACGRSEFCHRVLQIKMPAKLYLPQVS